MTADESFNLYFLSLDPQNDNQDIKNFIKEKLEIKNTIHTVKVVDEQEMDQFTLDLASEIKEY